MENYALDDKELLAEELKMKFVNSIKKASDEPLPSLLLELLFTLKFNYVHMWIQETKWHR